jgi:hypothetical protein
MFGASRIESAIATWKQHSWSGDSVELLASEAAISLENAVSYSDLLQEYADRKHAEEGLRRSETLLAEAQRLSQTGSFAWSPSSGEIY